MPLYSFLTNHGSSFVIVLGIVVLLCNSNGSLVRKKRFHSHLNIGVARTKTCGDNSTEGECAPGFFGHDCLFQCRCAEGDTCDGKGYCVENELSCAKGWFGDKCQHVDIAYNGKDYFADGDPETCSENTNINKIYYKFPRPIMFTFLRMVVLEDESFADEIMLSFVDIDGGDVECANATSFLETDDSLNVYCFNFAMVTHLILRWKDQRSVCSLHVDGGRSMALNRHSKPSERKAVDGNPSTRPEDCWSKTGEAQPYWYIEFEGLMYLYLVIITGRPDKVGNNMRGFTLALYDDNKNVVYSYEDNPLENVPDNKFSIDIDPYLIINKAEIFFNTTEVKNPELHICEFEAYGDCAAPFFGDTCKDMCPDGCSDDICDIEGHCYLCKDGFTGDECLTVDNSSSTDYYEDSINITEDTTTTTSGSTTAPDTDDVMDLVFLCLHVVFGTTIIAVIVAFVILRIKDYKSTRGSTAYSLAPSTMSGQLLTPKPSQKTLSIPRSETPIVPTVTQSKTMTFTAVTTPINCSDSNTVKDNVLHRCDNNQSVNCSIYSVTYTTMTTTNQ